MLTLLSAAHRRTGLAVSTTCEPPAPVPLDEVAVDGRSSLTT